MKQRKMIICAVLMLVFAYVYAHVAKTNLIYDKELYRQRLNRNLYVKRITWMRLQ